MTASTPERATRRIATYTTAALGASFLAATALAAPFFPGMVADFIATYPTSGTVDNVGDGTGSACQVCHSDDNGGDGYNAYGWALYEFMDAGSDFDTALMQAEGIDSDLDPGAFSNLAEILSDTQPGWTPGPNNTIYFEDGSTLPGQLPPPLIDGDLDPEVELGTRYCSPAVTNSSGMPGRLALMGSDVVADDDLTLIATDLPTGSNVGYFIMGTGMNTVVPPGSAGPICVAPGLKRFLPPVNNTDELPGGFARVVGTTGPISSNITMGSTWNFQAWHQDSVAGASNFTDAISVTFQ